MLALASGTGFAVSASSRLTLLAVIVWSLRLVPPSMVSLMIIAIRPRLGLKVPAGTQLLPSAS